MDTLKSSNDADFKKDLRSVRDVLVYAKASNSFFVTKKIDVREKKGEIKYYLTDKIFKVKRTVMVIL